MGDFKERRRRERALAAALEGRSAPDRRATFRMMLVNFLLVWATLAFTIALTPGIYPEEWWAVPIASLLFAALSPLAQVFLARLASFLGWVGAILLALFANAIIIDVILQLTPGMVVGNFWETLLASWIYAIVATVLTWLFAVNSANYLIVHAARMSMRSAPTERSEEPGVLFLQLDGVPEPVLRWHVLAGNVPTISRWLREGTHRLDAWVCALPSTTPVSQAGILHGDNDNIPAFRWYEKDRGELVVANHPPDAALIESRVSNGRGLLADGGTSISNLFSGDAEISLLTMSGMKQPKEGLGPSQSYAAFFTHPAGFVRAVVMTIAEMVKELYQARQQKRRGIIPRIDRHGSYVVLRGVTNVLLRDLNTALVVEAMMRGAKSIYVDYVDYDEIAHHAGVVRREATDALFGLDRVVASLERVANSGITGRPYEIVLVSDHGQSQGATFKQRYGQTLEQLVEELMGDGSTASAHGDVEAWGPVNVLISQVAQQDSVTSKVTRRAVKSRDSESALGPASSQKEAAEGQEEERPALVVIGSGNLGGIWFPRLSGRQTAAQLEETYPGLLSGLVSHPGVGFAAVMTDAGPVAIGQEGSIDLRTGAVTGVDPIARFEEHARQDLLRITEFDNAPDIYLVAWQVDTDLTDRHGRIYGAPNVHRQFVRWLERLGQRQHLPS